MPVFLTATKFLLLSVDKKWFTRNRWCGEEYALPTFQIGTLISIPKPSAHCLFSGKCSFGDFSVLYFVQLNPICRSKRTGLLAVINWKTLWIISLIWGLHKTSEHNTEGTEWPGMLFQSSKIGRRSWEKAGLRISSAFPWMIQPVYDMCLNWQERLGHMGTKNERIFPFHGSRVPL